MPTVLWLFFIPYIAAAVLFLLPSLSARFSKRLAALLSLLPLVLLLAVNIAQGSHGWNGQGVDYAWIPALSIHFNIQVDALSLLFLYLTAIIIPISILATPSSQVTSQRAFYGLILLLQGLLTGFFMARDLVLFTIFWEAMLLPLYFIINMWGGPNRQSAALKFLVYMIAGSALMVAAVLALYFASGSVSTGGATFNIDALSSAAGTLPHGAIIAAIFLLAFAVKTPLFPFHAWLPDAYCQASTTGTILLAGILSKAGIYGIVRIGMGIFPDFLKAWSPWLVGLAIAGVFYAGLAAWRQSDYKRLLAYSSLSHVNFILVGLFVWSRMAHEGALVQAINHGLTITALFLVAGWLEMRLGTTSIDQASGLAKFFPYLCWLTVFFSMASVALPGTNNFIGELLIFLGLFYHNHWTAAFLVLTVVLSVLYMLRWLQKMYFGPPMTLERGWKDLRWKDAALAFPLVALILWIGIYPTPLLEQVEPAAHPAAANATLEESP